jgi:hypothetical protein
MKVTPPSAAASAAPARTQGHKGKVDTVSRPQEIHTPKVDFLPPSRCCVLASHMQMGTRSRRTDGCRYFGN